VLKSFQSRENAKTEAMLKESQFVIYTAVNRYLLILVGYKVRLQIAFTDYFTSAVTNLLRKPSPLHDDKTQSRSHDITMIKNMLRIYLTQC